MYGIMEEIDNNKNLLKFCSTLAIAILAAVSFIILEGSYYQITVTRIPDTTPKRLLFWTPFYGSPWEDMHGSNYSTLKCHVHVCELAQNSPDLAKNYDALLFHTRDDHQLKLLSKLNPQRNPKQIYIGFSMEPPTLQYDSYVKGDTFYNWSVAPHIGSTVQVRYGGITKLNKSEIISADQLLKDLKMMNPVIGKSNTLKLLGVISRCSSFSKREKYIQQLKKHIPVDIFGGCGTKIASRFGGNAHWGTYLVDKGKYKFYLSFENSACKDYITEKLYTNAFSFGLVPIVYGGLSKEDYAKPGLLPPHSYIDTRDFESPKELVEYLKVLNKNDALYLRYHAWRRHYKIEQEKEEHWLCGLCHALHNKTLTSKSTTLNWTKFMDTKELCDLELYKTLIPDLQIQALLNPA